VSVGNKDVVYNPNDPTDAQIQDLDKLLRDEELSVADLVKRPEAIQLLLRQNNIQLIEQKSIKVELAELKSVNEGLREDREQLRIDVAILKERDTVTLMEIPISIVSGFAINLIVADYSSSIGWLLLLLSLSLLLFIRRGQIEKVIQKRRSK
jgi:hypothetical protein